MIIILTISVVQETAGRDLADVLKQLSVQVNPL